LKKRIYNFHPYSGSYTLTTDSFIQLIQWKAEKLWHNIDWEYILKVGAIIILTLIVIVGAIKLGLVTVNEIKKGR
jgi:hypothetical protein